MVCLPLKCFWFLLAAPNSLAQPVPIRPVFRTWWGRLEVRARPPDPCRRGNKLTATKQIGRVEGLPDQR